MAIIKCKMCGGDMELSPDKSVGTCEYCGSTMTIPKLDDDQRAAAFDRGNHFRRIGEFDKALSVYERIVQEDDADAEAHWCCALCRFGIEYVKDPASGEYLPTCHRASFDSFLEDVDYQAALAHADAVAKQHYQAEGEKIAAVQRGILSISQREQPFDVFICYKETDDKGQRTVDSTLAQDIYYQLTEQGCRVFFARITLEDKAGQEYEPYIFAALHSARVMVVVGTKPEYLSAVWVKNEWSRYLALMKADHKRLLIPCYRDMDPYDLPEQLSVLQSYDMSKIGFIQDLIRGVGKVLDADKPKAKVVQETVTVQSEGGGNLQALLKRGHMALEDGEWDRAGSFFDQVLNQDAECAEAYLGLMLAHSCIKTLDQFVAHASNLPEFPSELLAAGSADRAHIDGAIQKYAVDKYFPSAQVRQCYDYSFSYRSQLHSCQKALSEKQALLERNSDLTRARKFATGELAQRLEKAVSDILGPFQAAAAEAKAADQHNIQKLQEGYVQFLKDADALVAEKSRKAKEQLQADQKEQAELRVKKKKIAILCVIAVAVITAVALLVTKVIIPATNYSQAEELLAAGDYDGAVVAFAALGDYKDAVDRIPATYYSKAEALLAAGDKSGAAIAYSAAGSYQGARERSMSLWNEVAVRDVVSAAIYHTVALKSDGTVVATGSNGGGWCDVSGWTDIVAVSAGSFHTVGLKSDGTVVATGVNEYGQCDVSDWTDIVAVSARHHHTVGLKSDGTVVITGDNYYDDQFNVSDWTDIVAVSAGGYHTVGLKTNGTVVATGNNNLGQCNVSDWADIVAVSAGDRYTVGLKSDGTVVATGYSADGVSDWADIVAVSTGGWHTVGLKSDGTVVATGYNEDGQCDVSGWTDIVAVSAGTSHTVGLKSDGTVVATGNNREDRCNVSDWTDIKVPK